mmetsp:Transcript_16932/g.41245  ORF Transcript_16932/g.41245 Transcript_16932/m.41245 type:complete len:257 (+) Transcript_16932:975-1745(+)
MQPLFFLHLFLLHLRQTLRNVMPHFWRKNNLFLCLCWLCFSLILITGRNSCHWHHMECSIIRSRTGRCLFFSRALLARTFFRSRFHFFFHFLFSDLGKWFRTIGDCDCQNILFFQRFQRWDFLNGNRNETCHENRLNCFVPPDVTPEKTRKINLWKFLFAPKCKESPFGWGLVSFQQQRKNCFDRDFLVLCNLMNRSKDEHTRELTNNRFLFLAMIQVRHGAKCGKLTESSPRLQCTSCDSKDQHKDLRCPKQDST